MKFQQRAVAFIDVLGFSELVKDACKDQRTSSGISARERLEELVNLLKEAIPIQDALMASDFPKRLIPKHTTISDSIILSAPLRSRNWRYYRGLAAVVVRCIQVTQLFLRNGFLVRGGIDVGPTWHTEGNIVGTAYQEAYRIESKISCEPRILLSAAAQIEWAKSPNDRSSRLCIECPDGQVMTNGLHDYYFQAVPNMSIEDHYHTFLNTINHNISSIDSEKIRDKWQWFKGYLEAEASNNGKWHATESGFLRAFTAKT